MKDSPLSNADEILRLMRDGWELGWAEGTRDNGHFWLQKPALCRGGQCRKVHSSTAQSMYRRKLIVGTSKPKDPFWLRRYAVAPLILLCLLCGCGQTPDEKLAVKFDTLSEKIAELSYMEGLAAGLILMGQIRDGTVTNKSQAHALIHQGRTNWLATRPGKLTP